MVNVIFTSMNNVLISQPRQFSRKDSPSKKCAISEQKQGFGGISERSVNTLQIFMVNAILRPVNRLLNALAPALLLER
jgi:hypothetical protein